MYYKKHALLGLLTVISAAILSISSVEVNFRPVPDKHGKRAQDLAANLHRAKKGLDGNILSSVMSDKLVGEFKSVGLTNRNQIGKLFTLVWKDIKKRVPGQFGNLKFDPENTIVLTYPDHLLVIDINTLSLYYRTEVIKNGLKNLPTRFYPEVQGYGMLQENGEWKFDGFYDLSGKRHSIKNKTDEWLMAEEFADEAKK